MNEIIKSVSAIGLSANKFRSKLDFDQRCEILALYQTGQVSRSAIAEAYGINARTVTHIYRSKSRHYKSVRDKVEQMGREAFIQHYITEKVLEKLQAVKESRTMRGITVNSKIHSKMAGVHTVQNEMCSKPHRVIIRWCEAGVDTPEPGWYYQDVDGPQPNTWLNNGPDSLRTSKDCLDAIIENLMD